MITMTTLGPAMEATCWKKDEDDDKMMMAMIVAWRRTIVTARLTLSSVAGKLHSRYSHSSDSFPNQIWPKALDSIGAPWP